MPKSWKTETCGTCEFFEVHICRRNPPQVISYQSPTVGTIVEAYWPQVGATLPACGEWREEGGSDG